MVDAYIKEYKCYTRFHELECDSSYFILNKYCLLGEKIRMFNIELTGNEFYVIDGYFLLYRKGKLEIYSYNEQFNFTKLRNIDCHLLIFFIRKKEIDKNCRFLLYNILLHFIKNNVKKYEFKLRNVMQYICVDWLIHVKFYGKGIACLYKNGDIKFFNNKLEEVSKKEILVVKCKNKTNIKVFKNKVELNHNNGKFKDLIVVNGIKQYIGQKNNLFLLTKDSVKILNFEL